MQSIPGGSFELLSEVSGRADAMVSGLPKAEISSVTLLGSFVGTFQALERISSAFVSPSSATLSFLQHPCRRNQSDVHVSCWDLAARRSKHCSKKGLINCIPGSLHLQEHNLSDRFKMQFSNGESADQLRGWTWAVILLFNFVPSIWFVSWLQALYAIASHNIRRALRDSTDATFHKLGYVTTNCQVNSKEMLLKLSGLGVLP